MKRLVFSPAAVADLDHIWDYTAEKWSVEQADNYVEDIWTACRALADGLKTGRPVEVRAGYRKYRTGSHLVFYREDSRRLEVVRILHSRMDTERHLQG